MWQQSEIFVWSSEQFKLMTFSGSTTKTILIYTNLNKHEIGRCFFYQTEWKSKCFTKEFNKDLRAQKSNTLKAIRKICGKKFTMNVCQVLQIYEDPFVQWNISPTNKGKMEDWKWKSSFKVSRNLMWNLILVDS